MVLNLLDLNDLITLPAKSQHRALLPVVHIQGFLVEVGVVSAAESAGTLINLVLLRLLLLLVLRLMSLLLLLGLSCW